MNVKQRGKNKKFYKNMLINGPGLNILICYLLVINIKLMNYKNNKMRYYKLYRMKLIKNKNSKKSIMSRNKMILIKKRNNK